jgi:sterol desaturase/sphingolipid hydroxylase (fatty acid hydroxylase superfamily)
MLRASYPFPLGGEVMSWVISSVAFLAGWFVWTFYEYWLHRTFLHDNPLKKIPPWGPRHARHHADMHNKWGTPAHQPTTFPLVCVQAYGFYLLFPQAAGMAFAVGFVVGYLAFEVMHWNLHYWPASTQWGREIRKIHNYHHEVDIRCNYGTSTGLWDRVFRTFHAPAADWQPKYPSRGTVDPSLIRD